MYNSIIAYAIKRTFGIPNKKKAGKKIHQMNAQKKNLFSVNLTYQLQEVGYLSIMVGNFYPATGQQEKTFIYNHIKTIDMKKFRCYYTVKTTYYVEVLAQDVFEAKEKYDNGETLGEPEIFPVPQEPFAQVAIEEVKQPPARKIPCPP